MSTLIAEDNYSSLYLNWLKDNIEQFQINSDTFRITLPFLDRNNDHTELYIIDQHDGTFLITDDGAVLNDLLLSGFDFSSSKRRQQILAAITAAHGVSVTDDNELQIACTMDDLPLKKHMLAQCMVNVSDMFYLSRPNVQSIFLDDVQKFLDENDVRYVPNIFVTGKSKLTSHYDFVVSRSKKSAERLIKVINNMDLNAARNIIFTWNDTKDFRQPEAKLYTFVQDSQRKVSSEAIGALIEYGITPALWTERSKIIPALIA